MQLKIFYTEKAGENAASIESALVETYSMLNLSMVQGGVLSLIKEAYSLARDQYDASLLLKYLFQRGNMLLWIVDKDLYADNMNFIFGFAFFQKGAILSTHRLDTHELIDKEAIHEVGHVLGLQHCRRKCVMKFSNSLEGARAKPQALCENCRNILRLRKQNL